MALIRPCADLRNNYNEISKICHETKEAMYITKNGANDLVVLSNEAYDELVKNRETDDERIDRLVAKHFNERYENFEDFQKEVFEKVLCTVDPTVANTVSLSFVMRPSIIAVLSDISVFTYIRSSQ